MSRWFRLSRTAPRWALALTALALSSVTLAGPPPTPREAQFYQPLAELLRQVHRPEGLCYGLIQQALKRPDSAARRQLERLKSPLPEGLSADEELAYWINAYNTLMITRVAALWPIKSVKGALKGEPYAIFKERSFMVAGALRSLDELEHRLIRPRFKDPRVHAALNCASVSCPPLKATPYLPAQLNAQLDQVARAFARDPLRQRLNSSPRATSMIFKWYAEDFKADGGVRAWLARYLDEPLRAQLLSDPTPLNHLSYDWSLNEAPPARCQRPEAIEQPPSEGRK